jgi:diguanylate cyclase (GGDEF)-like protein
LWLAGSLASLPVGLALGLTPARAVTYAVPPALAGACCLFIPWSSLSERWLHLPALAGSLAVGIAVGSGGGAYAWLALLVVAYASFALSSRAAIAAETGLATASLALATIAGGGELAVFVAAAPAMIAFAALVTIQRERLETYSQRDPLTGVGNYRGLRERLRYEIVRHERHRRAFGVLLLDLDRFKLINDRYGHLEGDRLLRAVARALTKVVRDQDTVARQGGDEFSVLLPETGEQGAAIVAAKIDAALREIVVAGAPVTAAVGLAIFPHDSRTPESLLAIADERQRAAKQAGRARQHDRVTAESHAQRRVAA